MGEQKGDKMKVSENKVVIIHFSLKNGHGELLDTTEGEDPMAYIHGMGQMVPGLEKALENKMTGDKIQIKLAPEDGYGVYKKEWVQNFPLSEFGEQDKVTVGAEFEIETEHGFKVGTVIEIKGDEVVTDFNHPLADETLDFDVTIVDIREPTKAELSHGHVHGPGGHHH